MISKINISALTVMLLSFFTLRAQVKNDSAFDASVVKPAFVKKHPKILFDHAHNNYHRADGTYASFVKLATNDGCHIVVNDSALKYQNLKHNKILVIANAKGPAGKAEQSAFSDKNVLL